MAGELMGAIAAFDRSLHWDRIIYPLAERISLVYEILPWLRQVDS